MFNPKPLPTILTIALFLVASSRQATAEPTFTFKHADGQIAIHSQNDPVATYVYRDPMILRPYLAHVHTPGGAQVTRNHPPAKADAQDHATMHPGVWLAFGDVNGHDFWRNKAKIEHVKFLAEPAVAGDSIRWLALSELKAPSGEAIGTQRVQWKITATQQGYLITVDAQFSPSGEQLVFGDQEEMGLGVRVATPLAVTNGGNLLDSEGRGGEPSIWGKTAKWCAATGSIDGKQVGIATIASTNHPRPTRWHARNYGFFAANPLSLAAFRAGQPARTIATADLPLRLRFAVLAFDKAEHPAEVISTAERLYRESEPNSN